jgi:hypothetical protein
VGVRTRSRNRCLSVGEGSRGRRSAGSSFLPRSVVVVEAVGFCSNEQLRTVPPHPTVHITTPLPRPWGPPCARSPRRRHDAAALRFSLLVEITPRNSLEIVGVAQGASSRAKLSGGRVARDDAEPRQRLCPGKGRGAVVTTTSSQAAAHRAVCAPLHPRRLPPRAAQLPSNCKLTGTGARRSSS